MPAAGAAADAPDQKGDKGQVRFIYCRLIRRAAPARHGREKGAVTLKYLPTDTPHHFTPHSKILIKSGIRGSLNRDPPCSADTEPLTTRHPRRDDLTFVEHELSVCLFHFLSSPLLLWKYQYQRETNILPWKVQLLKVCPF